MKTRKMRKSRGKKYNLKTRKGGVFSNNTYRTASKAYRAVRSTPSRFVNYINNPNHMASNSLSNYELSLMQDKEDLDDLPPVYLSRNQIDVANKLGGKKYRTRRMY